MSATDTVVSVTVIFFGEDSFDAADASSLVGSWFGAGLVEVATAGAAIMPVTAAATAGASTRLGKVFTVLAFRFWSRPQSQCTTHRIRVG